MIMGAVNVENLWMSPVARSSPPTWCWTRPSPAPRLAREAEGRLRAAYPEIPPVDLARHDTLLGVVE